MGIFPELEDIRMYKFEWWRAYAPVAASGLLTGMGTNNWHIAGVVVTGLTAIIYTLMAKKPEN